MLLAHPFNTEIFEFYIEHLSDLDCYVMNIEDTVVLRLSLMFDEALF